MWRSSGAAGVLALVALLAAPTLPAEPTSVLVEDWSRQPDDKTGIPDGWKGQHWGSPKYELTVVADGPGQVLRLRSHGDSSTISKEIKIDVKRFPVLVWRWKAVRLPAGGDARRKDADDQAVQVYVTFPRFPAALRSRVIGYIWDTTAPAGTVVKSEAGRPATYVVVRSGATDLGRWIVETRNVRADYLSIYGEEPGEEARVVSVGIDSNDTRSSAESYVGEILFRTP